MALGLRQCSLRESRLLTFGKCTHAQNYYINRIHPRLRFYTHKAINPLRILFCGSDELSVASLRALHGEHVEHPERIASIDVVSRPGKRVGRGLKSIRHLPITTAAEELALPVHLIDTFTGWQPPKPQGQPTDLVIAVSFGLLVPARILNSCKYNGINVHPSLLPDFRGPAPLQHTLIHGRKKTGVTVQTLHPHRFDRGQIIAQTPPSALEIPNGSNCTYEELRDFISPICADMLLETIRQKLFVPPIKEVMLAKQCGLERDLVHASKITTDMSIINWEQWDADTIIRHNNALGNLWDETTHERCVGKSQAQKKRVIFHKLKLAEVAGFRGALEPGSPVLIARNGVKELLLSTKEASKFIKPVNCTIEGRKSGTGYQTLLTLFRKSEEGS